jgi:hypothetical protein
MSERTYPPVVLECTLSTCLLSRGVSSERCQIEAWSR